jgi:hypothetical protein
MAKEKFSSHRQREDDVIRMVLEPSFSTSRGKFDFGDWSRENTIAATPPYHELLRRKIGTCICHASTCSR